jgi:hypothetical protein
MPEGANHELFVMRRDGAIVPQITATNGITEWVRTGNRFR